MAEGKGATVEEKGEKGSTVEEKGEKGSTVAEKGKGVEEEAAKEGFVLEQARAMAVGKKEKGATEVKKGETAGMAVGKGDSVEEKGEKGSTVAEKGKGVAEEAAKEVAGGDTITLKSSKGKPFEVSKEAAARLSTVLAKKIAGGCSEGGIKLENIGSEALEKVIDYCNKHANSDDTSAAASSSVNAAPSKELEEWDRKLVDRLSQDALFDLVDAADMMQGKTPAQIREVFNIKNDFTNEEEEKIRLEHAWAFGR